MSSGSEGQRSRLARVVWWLLLVTPAAGFVGAIATGFTAHSPDEAFGGAGPDALLLFAAIVLAVAMLVRLTWQWRRLERPRRVNELLTALLVVPLFFVYSGIIEFVGWPHTRTAGVARFAGAAAILVAWTALVVWARGRATTRRGETIEVPIES